MNRCVKYIFFTLLTTALFADDDALSYGLQIQNGERIQKALKEMSQKECSSLFSQEQGEKIAFSYIQEACSNPVSIVRLEGLFGARNANNAAGTLLLEKALDDPHYIIRSYARRAVQGCFDSFIQQKLMQQSLTKRGEERLEAFSCLAQQDPEKALKIASTLFEDSNTPLAEKLALCEILSTLAYYKQAEKCLNVASKLSNQETLLWLATSCPTLLPKDIIINGLKSSSVPCTLAALEFFGLWGINETDIDTISTILREQLRSTNIFLRAKSAWVALCHIPELKEEAQSALKALSFSGDKEAALVSGVVSRSGKAGCIPALDLCRDPNVHPLVRLNASLQLIRYRTQLERAPFDMLTTLRTISRPLEWNEQSPGKAVLFAQNDQDDISRQMSQYKDASVRCSLLGLALNTSTSPDIEQLSYKMAEEVLKKKAWGPLLEGGTELFFQVGPKSLNLARRLSGSLHEEVRIQAAGILAAMHCEKEALEILKQEAPIASFDGKMAILALLPQFSMEDAVPFLTTAMKDTSSLLRTRAAGVFLFMKYSHSN